LTICSETRQLKDTVLNLQAATGVTDQSNYGNDGTYNGGMGVTDGRFEFDGSGDYMELSDVSDIDGAVGSISFWAELTSDDGAENDVISYTKASSTATQLRITYDMRTSNDFIRGKLVIDSTTYWAFKTPVDAIDIAVGSLVHVVVVHDGVAPVVYMNGELQTLVFDTSTDKTKWWSDMTAATNVPDNLTIGGLQQSSSFVVPFDGTMNDIQIIKRDITATEIRELYNATARPDIAGTVLHLRPETGLVDQSGTQDPGTYIGGMGVVGRRYVFDGTDDTIEIADDSTLKPANVSLSVWVKVPASISGVETIVFKEMSSGAIFAYGITFTSNPRVYFRIRNGDKFFSLTPYLGEWTHFALTFDGTTMRPYINGVAQTTRTSTAAIIYAATPLRIGSLRNGTAWNNQDIGEVRIFDNAITAAQVLSLYEGVPGYEPALPTRQIADTVLHLQADSGERDLSNHGNYGTFTGTDIAANSTDTEFVFNGTDDEFVIPINSDLQLSGNFTVSCRVTWDSTTSSHVFGCYDGNGWVILNITSTIYFARYGSTEGSPYVVGPTLVPGTEYHLAMTYDGTTLEAFVDGASVGTKALSGFTASANDVYMGRNASGGQYFGGTVTEARVITQNVSVGQIALLYNKGVRGYRPVGLLGGEVLALHPSRHDVGVLPGTVLQLDGKTGITDQSPAGNDGTYNGGMGVTDGKFVFDGTDDNISCPIVTPTSWTLAARINSDNLSANRRLALYVGDGGLNGFGIASSGNVTGRISVLFGGVAWNDSASSYTAGVDTHIVATWDRTTLTIYKDGSSVLSSTPTAPITPTGQVTVGDDNSTNSAHIGTVDDIRILDRALSATEVTTLYNNDISDESGNGNHGTLTNGAYVGEDDEIVFDGVNDYVDTGILWSASDTDLTVSAWIKSSSSSGIAHVIANYPGSTPKDTFILYLNSGTLAGFVRDSVGPGASITATNAGTANDNEWHHAAMVLSGTTLTVYLDGSAGTPVTNGSFNGDMSSGETVAVGRASGTEAASYFPGSIKDPRIFNRALTAAEVAFLASEYEVETPNTKGSVLSIVPSYDDWGSLAAVSAVDFSGNGNVGTLTGGPTYAADTASGGTRAIDYDGTNDYVDVGAISLQGEASAAAWLKIATTAGGQDHIISDIPQSGLAQFSFEVNRTAGKLSITWGGTVVKTGSTTLSTDQWYHVAVVRSGSTGSWTAELFVDGVSDGSGTTSTNPSTQNKDFGIAHSIEPLVSSYMEGTTDDIYIWPRVLSLDEIKALASTRNYFDCPVVSAIIQTRRRRLSLSGGML
jgi:hypothetical protein